MCCNNYYPASFGCGRDNGSSVYVYGKLNIAGFDNGGRCNCHCNQNNANYPVPYMMVPMYQYMAYGNGFGAKSNFFNTGCNRMTTC